MNDLMVLQNVHSSNARDIFIDNIKQWVNIDNQVKHINEKTKQMRERKHILNNDICTYMTTSSDTSNRVCISDGEIGVYDKKEYSSLTYDYIERKLSEIILDTNKVSYIINYLKDNREVITVKEVRRKYNK
jgi:hypothetical protein